MLTSQMAQAISIPGVSVRGLRGVYGGYYGQNNKAPW